MHKCSGVLQFITLCFIDMHRCCLFYKTRFGGSAGALFLMVLLVCVSGSHLDIITTVMVILSLVAFDVTIVIVLGCRLPM